MIEYLKSRCLDNKDHTVLCKSTRISFPVIFRRSSNFPINNTEGTNERFLETDEEASSKSTIKFHSRIRSNLISQIDNTIRDVTYVRNCCCIVHIPRMEVGRCIVTADETILINSFFY